MTTTADNLNRKSAGAFTLIELLSALAVISILGCLLLPAMARTRVSSTAAGCLSNFRQMIVGWAAYKDDNSDTLVLNAPAGGPTNGWCIGVENWFNDTANTNRLDYLNAPLAPYLSGHIEVYRCPGDTIPSQNGQRLRSCSMNSMVGGTQGVSYSPGWTFYLKGSDLTCPGPINTFVFADESMYTLDDGFLQIDLNAPTYPDAPANYHDGACGVSFADGHAEIHKWMYSAPGLGPSGLRSVPYAYGVTDASMRGEDWTSSIDDVDYAWLRGHTSCEYP